MQHAASVFAEAMHSFGLLRHESRHAVVVALSGGLDSMLLAVMCAQHLGARRTCTVTIDHGLRPESCVEAALVRWRGGGGGGGGGGKSRC